MAKRMSPYSCVLPIFTGLDVTWSLIMNLAWLLIFDTSVLKIEDAFNAASLAFTETGVPEFVPTFSYHFCCKCTCSREFHFGRVLVSFTNVCVFANGHPPTVAAVLQHIVCGVKTRLSTCEGCGKTCFPARNESPLWFEHLEPPCVPEGWGWFARETPPPPLGSVGAFSGNPRTSLEFLRWLTL